MIANVSEAGTSIAASLAAHAREAGAAALIVSVPYYWKPPQSMLVEHFAAIGVAGALPLYVYNSPDEMGEMEVASKTVVELLGRLPNFAGLIDSSLDWQYMIEVISLARAVKPDFQLVSGTEYMISARAIGATGLLSPMSAVTPRLVRELYDFCRVENYQDARGKQTDLAVLQRLLRQTGVPGSKRPRASWAGIAGRRGRHYRRSPTRSTVNLRKISRRSAALNRSRRVGVDARPLLKLLTAHKGTQAKEATWRRVVI